MSRIVIKPDFSICENKDADQLRGFAVTVKLISVIVFATWIVQYLFFLIPKFQASSYLLWLHSPVCVGPGRKPRRPVFSQQGSYYRSRTRMHRHWGNVPKSLPVLSTQPVLHKMAVNEQQQ